MRYVKLYDIRELHSYRCVTARLAYMWLVMAAGYPEGKKRCTLDNLAQELRCTRSAARHALGVLVKDNLIRMDNSMVYILDEMQHAASSSAAPPQQLEPLQVLRVNSDKLEKTLKCSQHGQLHIFFEQFCGLQELAGKKWTSDKDICNHFANWYRKQFGTAIFKASNKAAHQQASRTYEEEMQRKQDLARKYAKENKVTYEEYLAMKEKGLVT